MTQGTPKTSNIIQTLKRSKVKVNEGLRGDGCGVMRSKGMMEDEDEEEGVKEW